MARFASTAQLEVIIVGGSISGLMHGIMLKSLGHNVRILEKHPTGNRSDFGAGMGTGPRGLQFLQEYDAISHPELNANHASDPADELADEVPAPKSAVIQCTTVKIVNKENETINSVPQPAPTSATSWTAVYYRLRALFDGLTSPFTPYAPAGSPRHGKAIMQVATRVLSVRRNPDDKVIVTAQHTEGKEEPIEYQADLVIDAAGPYSPLRQQVVDSLGSDLQTMTYPTYAGFVAWRGVVPEKVVSEETRAVFNGDFVVHDMPDAAGDYMVGYAIPNSVVGSSDPGQRDICWVWYSRVPKERLSELLTDVDGHVRSNSVPRGGLSLDVWKSHLKGMSACMNRAFLELASKTEQPVVAAIKEGIMPTSSYYEGRLLLVGEAANLMQPNAGQLMNNSANQCLLLRDVLQGLITLQEWEKKTREDDI